jgi:hypothetical protein
MFFSDKEKFRKITNAIEDLETQLFYEKQFIQTLELSNPLEIQYKSLLNLRIISPWAARYFRCLLAMDGLFYKLMEAEFNKKISAKMRKDKINHLLDFANTVKKNAIEV